jgi:hypothetical protein
VEANKGGVVIAPDLLSNLTFDLGKWSTDPSRPDYACPAYLEMAPRWQICEDIRGATIPIRAKREYYLPKFEAETPKDYDGRIGMTFVADHYATTLAEHVGLVMAEPIKLGDDVPKQLKDLCEDIDGEGNHIDVFAQSALDAALHLGHCVLLTDYPVADKIATLSDAKRAQARPYVTLYGASDVLSWRYAVVGGVRVLVQIMLRESASESDGEHGTKSVERYRELRQEVFYDEVTARATALGAITWRAWVRNGEDFAPAGEGTIQNGPERIAVRVIYGGEKVGLLHTKPHLYGLALSNIEETQVASDYAAVMHKCNVPTPVFIGRNTNQGDESKTVQMGQGIDIPGGAGNGASMLEPSGAALGATRTRMQDLQRRMGQQGATVAEGEGGPSKTATEAAQNAKSRNAKLRRAARSEQDALEGVLADMAAFMNIESKGQVKSGGSVTVCQDFAGQTIDPAFLTVCVTAYSQSVLTLPELRYVIHTGQLPEDFDPTDRAILDELYAQELARQDQAALDAKTKADEQKAAA